MFMILKQSLSILKKSREGTEKLSIFCVVTNIVSGRGKKIMRTLSQRVKEKAKNKVVPIMPILIGALIILGIILLILYFLIPYLPENIRNTITLISNNDLGRNKNTLINFFNAYGNSKQYIFLFIQLLQVLFAPIPGQLAGLLGGFLFGFWQGLLLTMAGLLIGSFIAMSIGRILGESIVRKFISSSILSKFDCLISEGGIGNFFIIFLLPALPDDAVCFIAGLTRLSIWKLLFVCIIGRLPGMAVLTFAGASVDTNILLAKVIFAIAMILALFIWLFDAELKEYFYRFSMREKNGKEL